MASLYEIVRDIHDKVYTNFNYETDFEQFGTIEKWVMPDTAYTGREKTVGDCEDFALACRQLCRNAGLRTRLVICTLEGEGHCVLECNGWIFDCNKSTIVSRDSLTEYKWYYISGFEPGDDWHMITG